ncbi:hypothetical protein [Hymenobacter psychrotolerans]|uniref:Uncharacterized protein n=1 Tax=Hymenobacter psychrotolerans DSM 18569 TaxID=1121959 RepID=A0A1M7BLV7_9BACT|nr:hypothetical protein [Hymenobacter psychrotolerans]SHL56025.1 hypothetical protein SAMN02746009_02966 [Hymenobacter psychrotolerans DSM 18569]
MHFKTIADYYSHIYERFELLEGNGAINLSTIGILRTREVGFVNLRDDVVLSNEQFSVLYPQVLRYIDDNLIGKHNRISVDWLSVNFHDDVVNECVGIGVMRFQQNWKLFILSLLSANRAAEGGGTSLVLFDTYFDWAVHFELSQHYETITAEVYQRDYSTTAPL